MKSTITKIKEKLNTNCGVGVFPITGKELYEILEVIEELAEAEDKRWPERNEQ